MIELKLVSKKMDVSSGDNPIEHQWIDKYLDQGWTITEVYSNSSGQYGCYVHVLFMMEH